MEQELTHRYRENTYSHFVEQELLEAARNNNLTDLEIKLRSYPSNITQGPPPWLITGCKLNRFEFVQESLRWRPELVWDERLRDGKAMHLSCEEGNAEIVEILAKRHPELCHVKNHEQRSAVHIAAIGGKLRVLRALARVSPLSLRNRTSLGETALHVALKCSQFDSFGVLFQELCKLKLDYVLEFKDYNQNTVLHIATSMKQTKILQLLLLNNPSNGPMVDVNSKNWDGHTALDLHYQTDRSERSDRYISELLHSAAAKQAGHGEISDKMMGKTFILTEKTLSASLCAWFAGCSYSSLSNFRSAYPPGNYGNEILLLRAQDMIFTPTLVPDGFFYILFTSETFTLSMGWLLVIVLSLDGIWSFRFKVGMLFLEILTFTSFALLARKLVPRFKISFNGSSNISSFSLLCFCNLAVIFLYALLFLIKPLFDKISKRIKGRVF